MSADRFADRRAARGRRRGALRGLRAVPVPGLGAEEPDALAVRRARAAGPARVDEPSERSAARTECIVDPGDAPTTARAGALPAGAAPGARRTPAPASGSRPSTSSWSATPYGCRGTRRSSTRSTSRRSRCSPSASLCRSRSCCPAASDIEDLSDESGAVGRAVRDRAPVSGIVHVDDGLGRRAWRTRRAGCHGREHDRAGHSPGRRGTRWCATRSSPCTRCSRSRTARSCRCSTRRTDAAEARRGVPQRRHLPGARSTRPTPWCCRRRSSSTTTRRSRPRARATSATRPRSTRSWRCGC